ncbi:MAG: 4Fe-4S dicluster domain-containing protein [Euryarchaeota archaeon]|nr:4Fe-4S dicluster domain-containing protein [Euryarchaeota archaeon]
MSETKIEGSAYPEIDADECKGCRRCIVACPRKLLRLAPKVNRKGFTPAEYIGEGCTGCAICFYNCPEPYAIAIHDNRKGKA